MDEVKQVDFEKSLRETRYENGQTLEQLAETMKEVLTREEIELLVKLLSYEDK